MTKPLSAIGPSVTKGGHLALLGPPRPGPQVIGSVWGTAKRAAVEFRPTRPISRPPDSARFLDQKMVVIVSDHIFYELKVGQLDPLLNLLDLWIAMIKPSCAQSAWYPLPGPIHRRPMAGLIAGAHNKRSRRLLRPRSQMFMKCASGLAPRLDVQISDSLGVCLNELFPWSDLIAHQHIECAIRLGGIIHGNKQEGPVFGVHGRLP
jgi:hypothetical protein